MYTMYVHKKYYKEWGDNLFIRENEYEEFANRKQQKIFETNEEG